MQRAEFEMNLNLYGSDLSRWPEEMQFTAQRALASDPSLRLLVEEERAFEGVALRSLPADDSTFAKRIAQVALSRPPIRTTSWAHFWEDLRAAFPIPRPAYTFAVLALAGFFIGALVQEDASTSAMVLADNLDGVLYETGAVL